MSEPLEPEVAIFNATLQLPAAQRASHLEAACGGDGALRRRVEVLLHAYSQAGAFLENPVLPATEFAAARAGQDAGSATKSSPGAEQPGEQIGHYKLLQKIGEGGCGVVYMAEQEEPVRRRVALKIIKLGMDTRSVIARFEAERQALALMDHPGIAKVFDAGATSTGRPYFVMELVRGIKLTEFCDQNRLNTTERLNLFAQVCHAVQHAHQKGIIHRDLKPSNILVTVSDPGAPGLPKVIDFGIAKATQGRLANQTVFTAFEQFLGTPAYMSPEQAVMTTLEVDTRSDIYSLGVLLYELLTGQTPFDQHELAEAGLDAMRQVIRERDPVRPSTRLSSMVNKELLTVAQYRQSEPPRLIHSLRGDLDCIVMKCLQKERGRRYETANGLAQDVARFLLHEPVLARPDSAGYRATKFVRRHRAAVASVALIVLAIFGGLVGTITQAYRATRHAARADEAARHAVQERDFAVRQLSRAESINDLNTFLLSDAAPSGKPFTVGELLAQAEQIIDRPESDSAENRIEMLVSIGHQYQIQDAQAKAREVLAKAYALSREVADPSLRAKAGAALATAVALGGEFERGEALAEEALRELGDTPRFALQRVFCLLQASRIAREAGRPGLALERVLAAQRLLEDSKQGSPLSGLTVLGDVAECYREAGRHPEAAAAFERAFVRLTELGRERTERAGTFLNNWGLVVSGLGRPLEAEQLYRRAIAIGSADGTEDRISPMLLNNLARELHSLKRLAEAADYADRAYAKGRAAGDEIVVNQSLLVRASTYRDQGRLQDCAAALAELEPRFRQALPAGHIAFAALALQQARLAQARGDTAAALAAADQAFAIAAASELSQDALPVFLVPRAELRLQAGRLAEALADVNQGLTMEEAQSGPGARSSWLGRGQMIKGRILLAQGATEPARAAFIAAVEHLAETVGAEHPETREARQAAGQP